MNLSLARQYYERSLVLYPGNFLALSCFLKLLIELEDHEEIIRRINLALKQGQIQCTDGRMAKLKNMKAYIIWCYNPQEINYPRLAANCN